MSKQRFTIILDILIMASIVAFIIIKPYDLSFFGNLIQYGLLVIFTIDATIEIGTLKKELN